MADTYTSSLRIAQQTIGGNENSWGTILNSSLAMLDQGISGIVSISVTAGNVTLTTANNADDQARNALIIFTGAPGTTRTVTMPDVEKLTWVFNNTSDGSSITFTSGAGTTVSIPSGAKAQLYTDGATNVVSLSPLYIDGNFTPTFTANTTPPTGVTYGSQIGNYTRIGRVVFIRIQLILSSKGAGGVGSARIGGLPFSILGAGAAAVMSCSVSNVDLAAGFSWLSARPQVAGTNISLPQAGDNIAEVALPWSQCNDNSEFYISGFYFN